MITHASKFYSLVTKVSLFALISNFFYSCSAQPDANKLSNQLVYLYQDSSLVNDSVGKNWSGAIEKGSAHSGNNVAFVSASIPYGFSFKKNIQESFYCKNIKLIVEGWISVEDIDNAGSIAIQVRQKDSSLYWNEIDLKQKVKEKNTWTFVTDTFTIPRCLMSDYKNEIFTFMWNKTGVGKTLGDDFYIKIVENKMPSFIPDVNPPENENYSETILKGNFNSIVYDKKNGLVSIADKNGKLLTSALTYYEDVLLNNKRGEVISCNRFLIKQKSNSSIILTTSSKTTDVTIEISSDINSPKLIFNANVKSKVDLQINRRSLILGYKDDLKQVYRKNTQIDTTSFQDEYWLNKEGCKIGEANRSIVFYRNNSISSTQLNAKRKILVFNFDFASDHLLMRFPVRDDDKKGIKTDVSANAVKSGSEQTYSLNLYVGSSVQTIPVFMQQPNAYLSSFIITEHADYTDLLTNYAVYYGSSDVNSSSKASGGFCKYKIPVTKSIFYHNPENTNNKIFNGAFTSEMSCWKDNVPYQKFINDIHSQGTEIAFHTPDYATSTREFMNDALSELTKKYGAVTWIDHGYDNGRGDNREDLVCDGLVPNATNYSLDLWEKYNVKYFWNCYNEDSVAFGAYNFSNKLKNPYLGYGDQFPSPFYSKNKINQSEVISWPAHVLMDFKDENLWDYYFDNSVLSDMAQNRETVISHMYPARVDSITCFYNSSSPGKFVVNPKFDLFLSRLAQFRDNKQICLTTIKDHLDYSLALENIEMTIDANGTIRLKNKLTTEIKGFTLYSIKQLKINCEAKKTQLKATTYLYSFDFKPGQVITVN